MPVWHVSLSRQDKIVDIDAYCFAHQKLEEVGGPVEWWLVNRRSGTGIVVAHLRVGVTVKEHASMPNACALADAGNAGTMRRRGTAFRLNL
jgi:hypothetical protein